jgi:hypothetical protein
VFVIVVAAVGAQFRVRVGSGVGSEAVSTVQVRAAGEPSTLPAPSVARTLNVWEPSANPE